MYNWCYNWWHNRLSL
ncbi:uncharacterized protein ACO6RY_09328 [Pungitius sinensis]